MIRRPRGDLIAGVDCSTQRTKVVVVSPDDGLLVASASAPHRVYRDGARSESDPEQWWQALITALAATGCASRIGRIGIAAQQLGLVLLDRDDRPLRRAILWDDTRSSQESADLIEALGQERWLEYIGSPPQPGLTVASWAWVRRPEPQLADRVAAVRLPHDYLTGRLTGAAVTDRGDASGTGWWSARHGRYLDEVLDHPLVALAPHQLPEVLGPLEIAGEVTHEAAAATALPAGALVSAGTGDNMAAALALGVEPGQPVMSLGTSGTIYVRSTTPSVDATGQVFGHASASGDHLPLACSLNATVAVDRVASLFGLDREAVAARTRVVVMPYLGGERLPDYPSARASIVGIDHATTPGEILLATYEGVVASLLDAVAVLDRRSSGLDPAAPITLIGGGSRGGVWRDTLRRFAGGRALHVPEEQELVAWGAAVQAAAAGGIDDLRRVAERWEVARGRTLPPLEADQAQLEHLRRVRAAADGLNRVGAWG